MLLSAAVGFGKAAIFMFSAAIDFDYEDNA